jgi:hypothetical protein
MWEKNRETPFVSMAYAFGALGGRSHLLRFQWVAMIRQSIRYISNPKVSLGDGALRGSQNPPSRLLIRREAPWLWPSIRPTVLWPSQSLSNRKHATSSCVPNTVTIRRIWKKCRKRPLVMSTAWQPAASDEVGRLGARELTLVRSLLPSRLRVGLLSARLVQVVQRPSAA